MSRGGIGKSKKTPPPPPAKGKRRRGPRTPREPRPEPEPRPGLAVGVGGIMLGIAAFVLFAGVVLIADEQEGGDQMMSLGLATMPIGFATVAGFSRRLPVIKTTLLAFLATVGSTTLLFAAFLGFGFGALFTAMTMGVGVGGVLSLRMPDESSNKKRLIAVGIATVVVLLLELIGLVPIAIVGPFAVLPALNFVDNKAITSAALSEA